MKLTFRQGIVRYQTDLAANPVFLQKHNSSGQYIDLMVTPDPTLITFAHGDTDYLFEETKTVVNAWGPFQPLGQTQWLYWDVNLMTGAFTRSFTLLPPITGVNAPTHPSLDQHWFDRTANQMKVWDGSKWVIKIRCFAAEYSSNAVLINFGRGSQVGLNGVNIFAGSIIYGKDNRPLRHQTGTLVTSEDDLIVGRNSSSHVKFDASLVFGQASEPIPQYRLVSFVGSDKIALASYLQPTRQIAGLVVEDLHENEVGKVLTHGRIQNEQWNWDSALIGYPLFCGQFGEVTIFPPPAGIVQQVGLIQGVDTINLSIMIPILISL